MRIFIAIGGLLVILLSAVLIAPLFVDWTAFRADFEREASRILGQPVRVLGEAEARLLPFPSLTFTDVVVGESDAEPTMTLARFSMDAELAPYLSGEIRIFQMRLDEPHLRVPMAPSQGEATLPTLSALSGSPVVLENVVIAGGRISLQNAETGRSREFTGIDAELSAQTLSGPFAGGGALSAEGEPLSFTLSSGLIEQDGSWSFRLGLGSQRLGAAFSFDGATTLGDGEPDFSGRFDLATPTPTDGEDAQAPALLPPVRVTSEVEISRREAAFGALRAEIGPVETPYVLTGEGTVDIADIPHFDLTLRGEQVDVDALAGETDAQSPGLSFVERAEAVRATLAAIPRIDVPGRIELTLPLVTAGDTVIRDLRFSGSPADDGWTIDDLSAELPGRTLVEASGILAVRQTLGFSGDLLVAARQPSRFSAWLTGAAAPEIAELSRAGFSAKAELSAELQRLDDLEVDVGGQRLTGRLERGGVAGARTISADLGGEAADLDAFLAFARLFTDGATMAEPVETLDLRFDAGPVLYDGISAEALSLDFSYGSDVLDLRHLIAEDLAGATIDARGTVADFSVSPRPDLAAEFSAEEPARFVAFLEEQFPNLPFLEALRNRAPTLGPLVLSGTAATPIEAPSSAIELRLEGTAGETRVALASAVENGVMAPTSGGRFGVDLTLASDEPAALMRQFGFAGLDLGLPGPLEFSASLSGDGAELVTLSAAGKAPGSSFSADGSLTPGGGGFDGGDLNLGAASEDASLWLTAAGIAFGQGLDALPVDLGGRLTWGGGDWAVSDLAGTAADTTVEASLNAAAGASVTGSVKLGELSLPWLATMVYAAPPQSESTEGLWPGDPFGEPLLVPRGFAVLLDAERLVLGEGRFLSGLATRLEGGRDHIRLAEASAELNGGRLSGTAEMLNAGGFGSLRVDLALADARLPETAPLAGLLSGRLAIEGSGRSFAEIAASLTGEGEALLDEGFAEGIAPGRLAAILSVVDVEGFDITSQPVAELVAAQDQGARYPLGSVRSPVAVAVGTARILPATAETSGESVTGSGTIDLRTGATTGALTLAFEPDEDERIEDTAPAVSYELSDAEDPSFDLASVEPLTSYLSLRAYAREQARLEALREELRETVRLRREARLYRSREVERRRIEAERIAAEQAEIARIEAEAEERERVRVEQLQAARQAEAARAAEEEARAQAAEAAEAEAERERQAEAARQSVETAPLRPSAPPPASQDSPPIDFDLSPPAGTAEPPRTFEGLPGVTSPLDF